MAGKYTKKELKKMLHRSTFQVVAEGGIESMTIRRVSRGCGLSDPYVYQCYSDLKDLMTDAFLQIDKEIAELISDIIKTQLSFEENSVEKICWVLWSNYWSFLMKDSEKILFYWRFYQSGYYNREILEQRRKNFRLFISFMKAAGRSFQLDENVNVDALVSAIIDSTVSLAVKIHLGYMKEGDIPVPAIYGSVFAYLLHLFGIDVWKTIFREEKEEQKQND